jgi:cytochrome c
MEHSMSRPILAAAALLGVVLVLPAASSSAAEPGDLERGRLVYGRCMACHSITRDAVGPRHAGLFGRLAGSVPGYDYSPSMRRSGIVWDAQSLDAFVKNPRQVVPGTKMPFSGIEDDQERADLIAYLQQATRLPP